MKSPRYGLVLRRWLVSIMLLLLCTALSSVLALFEGQQFSPDLGYRLLKLSGGLVVFLISIHHLVWWHFVDLFDKEDDEPRGFERLGSYAFFFVAYAARTAGVAVVASGVWDKEMPCRGVFIILFQSCIGPPPQLSLPISVLSLVTYIICLFKTAAVIRSRARR